MSQVRMFDSWDAAMAAMQADEDAANARLTRSQRALRDAADQTVYAVAVHYDGDLVVFHVIPPAEDAALRARGYLTGTAYSAWEPDGEHGDVHVSQVMPISRLTFVVAREEGWPNTVQDPSAYPELVGDMITVLR